MTDHPQHDLNDDYCFWEDKEVMESKTVGATRYTRGYIRGTDIEAVWATRASGATELVSPGDDGITAGQVWVTVTAPHAPTELGEQMQLEDELAQQVPSWADREVELERELLGVQDELDFTREDFERGDLDQSGYKARLVNLHQIRQAITDELATYEMERGETAAQEPVLDQYAEELAADGITAIRLADNDWQPRRS